MVLLSCELTLVGRAWGQALSHETFGMRPLVAHCHLGLGKLYRCTGTPQQAQEHLTTATTMHREVAMRLWLEKAETTSTGRVVGQRFGRRIETSAV